ncbi:MAG: hypothetical protein MK132_10190 [Lentisphaerales bacterium]|nr:hypothetical protein [Lentisphaerales bacterium]
MKYLLLTHLLLLTSCSFYEVSDYYSEEEIHQRAILSSKHTEALKMEAEKYTLEEKALHFEKILTQSMHPKLKFLPKIIHPDQKNSLRIDTTLLFLSALAFKYGVTQNEKDKLLIEQIIDAMWSADESNGLDGYLPYKIAIHNDQIKILTNETHENVYAQFFFAYLNILKYVDDTVIKQKIKKHTTLIAAHFLKDNFTLHDNLGAEVPYSDLSPSSSSFNNRRLSLLALIDSLQSIVEDPTTQNQLKVTEDLIYQKGYPEDILDLTFNFVRLEFPTHSSSWLNILKIYNGCLSSGKDMYKKAFTQLMQNYQDEHNPFFELIGHAISGESPSPEIKKILKTFPKTLTNQEVINTQSYQGKIICGDYVKLKGTYESLEPLPIYQRPLNNYLWKRNQMTLDGNFKSSGDKAFTGIDFLQAYWMMRALEKNNN